MNYFSFVISSFIIGLIKLPRNGILFVESPPLLLGISGYLLKLFKKNSFINKWCFEEKNSYNDAMLVKPLGLNNEDEVKPILKWYARYELGKQIYDCIEENGQCHFEAEL